ncbi:MAG: sensor histidine kinase [Gemmatimonadaceae bacterium]
MRPTPIELRVLPLFADLTDDEAAWIAERSEAVALSPGDVLFRVGEPAAWMFVVLEGTIEARRDERDAGTPAFLFRAGELGGIIPFSRMTHSPATGRAVTATRVARFPKAELGALLARIPRLEPRFVAHLADRVRESTRRDQQQEKLAALGRLAAGLAHELNNPAAAVQRFVVELRRALDALESAAVALASAGAPATGLRALHDARARLRDRTRATTSEDSLARSDREDALAARLEALGVVDPWVAAASLADAGVTAEDVAEVTAALPAAARPAAVAWLAAVLSADALLAGIGDAAERITELVASVKTYTHLDRGTLVEDVDLRAGLESTLALFAHRLRQRGVALERDYAAALPRVIGRPGELNQVWTNLIDNASDAAATRVTVRTAVEQGAVLVEVRDDGPGIPQELQDRVWEPFFTTKPVGRGTGLGLDIARRIVEQHGGRIVLRSAPGDTRFCVSLPPAESPAAESPAAAGPVHADRPAAHVT